MAKKLTQEEFIRKCIDVHGDKYDHSKILYVNSRTKIEVICYKHGSMFILPDHYLSGYGCKKCGQISAKQKMSYNNNDFILKANEVHGNKYDYSKVEYINSQTKVTVICKEHGEFSIKPNKHIHSKNGCNKCGTISSFNKSKEKRTSDDHFIEKCVSIHGDLYDYSKTRYSEGKKVTIICKSHGEFKQIAYDHLDGHGCPKCPKNTNTSIGHKEILEFLDSEGIEYIKNDRTVIYPQEIDIYIKKLNIAIEFNGVYWHSKYNKSYHFDKYKACKDKNIALYQFWDIDWKSKKNIIKSIILSKCKGIKHKIDARKCEIKSVDICSYKKFLIENHIQGYCYSKIRNGLYFNNELVAVIGFNKNILTRYCQKTFTSVRGGISRLLKYSINENTLTNICTFSDNMYSNGNVYSKIGFVEIKKLKPDYKYFDGKTLIRKEHFRKKRMSKYNWYDSNLSEHDNMMKEGYLKIYDAGKIKWLLCYF